MACDTEAIAAIHAEAFANPDDPGATPVEVGLVDDLRNSGCWIPELSLVLAVDDKVIGHVVCTRAWIDGTDVLGLGPIGLLKSHQLQGGGSALMHAVLGAADAMGEPLVGLLGSTEFYPKFGFVPATDLGIEAPESAWGAHFQARTLSGYRPDITGRFAYAPPFDDV